MPPEVDLCKFDNSACEGVGAGFYCDVTCRYPYAGLLRGGVPLESMAYCPWENRNASFPAYWTPQAVVLIAKRAAHARKRDPF